MNCEVCGFGNHCWVKDNPRKHAELVAIYWQRRNQEQDSHSQYMSDYSSWKNKDPYE